jgi:DNA-binding IclR family transcriptional regulator
VVVLHTLEKAGRVLDLFQSDHPEWGVTDTALALEIPRSSAHALLSSLAEIGLLQRRDSGRYQVGWRVIELAEVTRQTADVRSAAAGALERLAAKHGETCHLAVRDRNHVLYVDKMLGTHNVTVQGARVGTRLDMYCTSVGKALLAYADAGMIETYLAHTTLRQLTPHTITHAGQLRANLEQIRTQGIAVDLGEAAEDLFCVAAPIRDDFGKVVAAISLSAPNNRFTRHREAYTASVKAAAAEISRALVDSHPGPAADEWDYPHLPVGNHPAPGRRHGDPARNVAGVL